MIEVLTKCKSSATTFFLAVHIMDKYLKFGPKGLPAGNILLIGLIAMELASKFEDVDAISIELLEKRIAHGKYSDVELKKMEIEMLIVLNFDLKVTFCCDFLGFLSSVLSPPLVINRTAEIILILNTFDYNNYYSPCEEAAAALYIAAQSLNQSELANQIFKVSDVTDEDMEIAVISMKNHIYQYKIKPPKFKNPMRELGFSFECPESPKFFKFDDPELESCQLQLMNKF